MVVHNVYSFINAGEVCTSVYATRFILYQCNVLKYACELCTPWFADPPYSRQVSGPDCVHVDMYYNFFWCWIALLALTLTVLFCFRASVCAQLNQSVWGEFWRSHTLWKPRLRYSKCRKLCCMTWDTESRLSWSTSLVPRPHPGFWYGKRGEPGMFPHVSIT